MNGFASVHEAPRRGRVEVLGGPPKRRRFSTEEKAALVAASLEPGASVSELARRRGMHPQVLFTWRRLAREGKLALPADALPMFAAVVAADDTLPTAQAEVRPAAPGAASGEIVVELGALRLRIGADVPPARVAALVSALQAAR
jgi:transposase